MTVAACPACAAVSGVEPSAEVTAGTHTLVLPGMHCAACIGVVERTLLAQPDIRHARVNLTQRRAIVWAKADADAMPWIEALAKAGYEAHEAQDGTPRDGDNLMLHLGVAGFAMMNVMLLSVAVWSGAAESTRELFHWVSAAIALPATAFAAQPFFRKAWSALRVGRVNMDVPISLAVALACGMSLYEVLHGGAHTWFDAALSLTFFLLGGRVLDQRLRRAARSAAENLAAIEPRRALVVEGDARVSRPVTDVAVGDTVWLPAGSTAPVDGHLLQGAQVDRSAITGESDVLHLARGEAVHAGDVVLSGPVTFDATAVGEDTTLRRMAALVAVAEGARGRYRGLADRAAEIYTPAVHIISAGAFAGWFVVTGDIRAALNVAIATLIITCPCALGLAVPAVAVAATSRLYRAGLLVKSETALERLAEVDTVVFDKTGTLTRRILTLPDDITGDDRRVIRALADGSDHPLCRELRDTLADVRPVTLSRLEELAGEGVSALWGDVPVRLARGEGGTVFTVGARSCVLGQSEVPVSSAAPAVADLFAAGFRVAMLTGDTSEHAECIARRLGIDEVHAGVLPDGKAKVVSDLRDGGARVLMVGDGLNDTAALASAHASIAPGSALDVSRNAADVVIVTGDLTRIAEAIRIAKTARRRALQNFGIAACYNAVAVPIAVLGFATPLAAAIAMSTSSVTVVLNALRGDMR